MKIKRLYFGYIVIFFAIALFTSLMFFAAGSIQSTIIEEDNLGGFNREQLPIIESQEMFFYKENFEVAITEASLVSPTTNIKAVVVPHHLLASKYTAKMLKLASGRQIDKVVIIGPNHENLGANIIATAKASWETPGGYVNTDEGLTDSFMSRFQIQSTPLIFKHEHSIGAIVPFVKYYYPEAKILPIILTSNADLRQAGKISNWLVNSLNEKSLIIISVDFSHYLTKDEAEAKDRITKDLIIKRDVARIVRLDNNDYVDSPASLAAVLLYANAKNLKTTIHDQGNSFDFLIEKPTETTSYFAISFEQ